MEVLKQFLQAVVSAVSDSHEELKKKKKLFYFSLHFSLDKIMFRFINISQMWKH